MRSAAGCCPAPSTHRPVETREVRDRKGAWLTRRELDERDVLRLPRKGVESPDLKDVGVLIGVRRLCRCDDDERLACSVQVCGCVLLACPAPKHHSAFQATSGPW